MVGVIKSSSAAASAGIGAGGGAAVGALATLLSERPSLIKALRNALIGGAGGAAIGGGLHALQGGEDGQVAPSAPAPPASPSPSPSGKPPMKLGESALAGLIPGFGPATHGGMTQGWKQGVGSGAASIAGMLAAGAPIANQAGNAAERAGKAFRMPGKFAPIAAGGSVAGAVLAAIIGNKLRE